MKNRKGFIKELCKQNQLYIMSFLIPFFIMLLMFIMHFIYPFGDQSFLSTDLYHQYFPFLTEFYHKLKEGDSLFFSWNAGLGSNFLALYSYYLATPFYWLCVMIPEAYLMEFICYLVVFKIGLCGLTACIYLSHHFNTRRRIVALFALFYALSGYMAAYNWNVMWLDCLVLTPLIILGLEELVNKGKYKLYCLTLALAILSNYYISIMICIYLVLYFLIVLLPLAKEKTAACIRFILYSLLSGGISATLLFPVMAALRFSRASTSEFPNSLEQYLPLFDVLGKHFINVDIKVTPQDYWPNIYCSVAVFLLFPLYLFNKKIPAQEKRGKVVLLFLILLSFCYNITSFIWHGFNYPNGLPARQSFLYILLMLTVCLESFIHIREVSKKDLTTTYGITFLFVFLAQKLITDDSFSGDTFFATAGFLTLYAVFLYLLLNYEKKVRAFLSLMAFVIILEAASNTLAISIDTVPRSSYLQNYDTFHELSSAQSLKDTGKFYRYENIDSRTDNDSLLHDYPSVSMFSSTNNALVNTFYNHYGMRGLRNYANTEGMTPFLSALLSCGYTFSKSKINDENFYVFEDMRDYICLYRNVQSIPMGFFIAPDQTITDDLITNPNTASVSVDTNLLNNPILNQNLLAENLGSSGPIFTNLESKDQANGTGISTIYVDQDSYIYAYCDNTYFSQITAYTNNQKLNDYSINKSNIILDLGYHPSGTVITLQGTLRSMENMPATGQIAIDPLLHTQAYRLDTDCLSDVVAKLNTNTLTMESMTSDSFTGTIAVNQDGYLIISVPYDPGFTVMVDGIETAIRLFENMMIAVPLTAGEHTVSLEYYPAGLNTGLLISLISLAAFVIIAVLKKRKVFNQ